MIHHDAVSDKRQAFDGVIPDNASAVLDGWLFDDAHYYAFLVQFEDTDAGGIVYHANYLSFAERGRSAWLRLIGVSQDENLYDRKMGFVVRRASLSYFSPLRLGDEVIVETRLKDISKARITAEQLIISAQQVKKEPDGHIFAKVEVEIVMVNEGGRPIRFPLSMLEKMSANTKS
ncbi:MAG: YbgC/FadM family acyl-CoA thioesterase [Candidatus Puniceispirillaceae bacterium]